MVRFTALVATLGYAAAKGPDFSAYSFEKYIEDFSKTYTQEELSLRRVTFAANLKFIKEHNTKEASWYAAPTQFMDMTAAEFAARVKGTGVNPPLDGASKHMLTGKDVPAAVDWRQAKGNQVVTPVKNQGGCGSCWAFSTAETLESFYAIATGKDAPILAPQQLVSCTPNPLQCGGTGGCEGATQEIGFNYTSQFGLGLESSFPYEGEDEPCSSHKLQPVATNAGYVKLTTNSYTELIDAVANQGPIAISVAAGSIGWQLYGGGVLTDSCGVDIDHAVQLVGYGTDSGKDYWIVRNSWGASWGEEGYIRIERFGEGKEPCGMDTTPQDGDACKGDDQPIKVCGLCGILSDSSYPTGVRGYVTEINV